MSCVHLPFQKYLYRIPIKSGENDLMKKHYGPRAGVILMSTMEVDLNTFFLGFTCFIYQR